MSPEVPELHCFYCDVTVSEPYEYQRDHFPVPRRCAGTDTVIACVTCHHQKDRCRPEETGRIFDEAFRSAGEAIVVSWADFLADIEANNPPAAYATATYHWQDWPREIRITAARLLGDRYELSHRAKPKCS